jgi:hypothetical protein
MEKQDIKNNMTVVHLAFGGSKPIAPQPDRKISIGKTSDPSSAMRSDRYPVPGLFENRSEVREKEYA